MEHGGIFRNALCGDSSIAWNLGRLAKERYPEKALLDGVDEPFDLMEFADAGQCEAVLSSEEHASMSTSWTRAHGLSTTPDNAIYHVRWRGHALTVIVAQWREGWDRKSHSLVLADSMDIARAFAHEACAFCNDPRESILRFIAGCWSQSHDLWKEIQSASFEDLVLAGDLKERIQRDFAAFIAARSDYERYRVPYRRGVLLVGPPGNGKTHCLRALIKFLGVPCLYVQSFKSKYGEEDSNIERVFQRAREVTPCVLVFEDLDAMIHDQNRSFFLNQLDGIGDASGLLTIATTNHVERLDPAIVDRPSRFDRKYHFALPSAGERSAYLRLWNEKLDPKMRISGSELESLVESTHDFSFAYLKELYLSSMMQWMADKARGTMSDVLRREAHTLRLQMRTGAEPASLLRAPPEEED